MSILIRHTDHLGGLRKLGWVAPTDVGPRATAVNIQTVRKNAGLTPLIAQADWVPCDYTSGPPDDMAQLLCNQGQEGSCTAWSDVGAGARQRYIRTGQILVPSGYFVYDQINGGSDNGSNIRAALTVMQTIGAPTIAAYPRCLYPRNGTPVDKRPPGPYYTEDVGITVATSMECATALQMGMFPQVPIQVNGDFERFVNKIAWGGKAPATNASNHSIYLAGMVVVQGVWYFILVNSWGRKWGPFGNGTCLIPLAAIDNPAVRDDGWCHANTPSPVDSVPDPVLAV